jgi:tellurite resistance protein
MTIDRENYGQYIIDYYDGNLSPEEKAELLLFLEQHPDLQEEFNAFASAPLLKKETIRFPLKASLKQPEVVATEHIHEQNYPAYFVWAHDGELSSEEQQDLTAFLTANPQLKEEYLVTGKAKVIPDKKVLYPDKEQLKKRTVLFWWPYAASAVAALLLLFWGLSLLIPHKPVQQIHLAYVPETVKKLPSKSAPVVFSEKKADIKKKKITSPKVEKQKKHPVSRHSLLPIRRYKPVNMLASADITPFFEQERDYAPLRFPTTTLHTETLILSEPVVVEKVRKDNLFRKTLGKPFSELAAVLALQKKKRRAEKVHDKGFVKILEKGVDAVNALTDHDMVMVKTYDANGNLIDYHLLSDNFSINRPVRTASLNR